ncbi:MAG: hypothetical protein HZB16_16090 [Armatimonadetes bacterium]|nr:hypothetical protein [Armatimonadota bacterium]
MDGLRHINQYLDGRMGPDERERFEAELANSPELAAEVASTREAIELLRALPLAAAPDDLTDRIMGSVRALPRPVRPSLMDALSLQLRRPAVVAFAGAMTVVMALLGANLVGGPGDEPVVVINGGNQVRLSNSDSQFVNDCLADYQVVAVSSVPSRPPAREE